MICSVIRKMIHVISRVSEHTNVTFLWNVLIKSIVMTVKTGSSFNILSPLYCKLVSFSPAHSGVVSQRTSCESRHRKDTDALGHPDLLLSVDECAVDLSLVTVLETKKESYKQWFFHQLHWAIWFRRRSMETMDLFMISASTSHLNLNHLSVVVYFIFFERSHRSLFLDSISSLFSHSPHALSYFLSRVSGVSSWKWLLFFCTEVVDMKTSTLKESRAQDEEKESSHNPRTLGYAVCGRFCGREDVLNRKKWKRDVEVPVDHVDDDLSVCFSVDADRSWLRNKIPSPPDFMSQRMIVDETSVSTCATWLRERRTEKQNSPEESTCKSSQASVDEAETLLSRSRRSVFDSGIVDHTVALRWNYPKYPAVLLIMDHWLLTSQICLCKSSLHGLLTRLHIRNGSCRYGSFSNEWVTTQSLSALGRSIPPNLWSNEATVRV